MALDLFRVVGGVEIQSDNLTSRTNILTGPGLPGGDGGVQDAAPIGSIYHRIDANGDGQQIYWKFSTSNNSAADWKTAADKGYVDAAIQGLSWRSPVLVRDGTAYANSSAFPTGGVIDSVALSDGARVLFTNVGVGGERNVWIWNASGSTWTEDPNAESDGDALLVQEGTSGDTSWVYDGSNWVQFSSSTSTAEIAFIRTFIGKTGPGAENPSYTTDNVVTQAGSLEDAVGELDAAFGDGIIDNDGGNHALSDDLAWATGGTLSTTDAFNEINVAIGDRTYSQENVVSSGETVATSIEALDVAIGEVQDQTTEVAGTNVAAVGGITIDTIPLNAATQIKWLVQVRENATPANRRALEVHAINDGSTLVDHTEYGVLFLGSAVAGFDVNVDINGSDMRLRLTATNNVDYVVKRIAYSAF